MERVWPGLVMAGLALLVCVMLWAGWRGRLRRQSGIAAPPEPPKVQGRESLRVRGQYVVTTVSGDWLDRIAVHGLGIRTDADAVVLAESLLFERSGAAPLHIPAEAMLSVRLEGGMAGKFVEPEGLVVIEWMLGDRAVDTGFRARVAEDKDALVASIQGLLDSVPGHRRDEGEG